MPPDVDAGDGGDGPLLAAEKGDAGQAKPVDDLVDDPDLVVEHPEPQQRDDHVGHQERQQQGAADQRGFGHPVHQERQPEGDDGLETNVQPDVLEGDGHGVPEQLVGEDRRVVPGADPGGIAQDAVLGEAEVDAADRGHQEESDEADHGRKDKEQRDPQVAEAASPAGPGSFPAVRGLGSASHGIRKFGDGSHR